MSFDPFLTIFIGVHIPLGSVCPPIEFKRRNKLIISAYKMLNTLLLHLATCVLVIAQSDGPLDPQNHFVYPGLPGPAYSDDPTVFALNQNFTVGEDQSQPFKWITNMTSTRITLWQEGNPDKVQQHIIYGAYPRTRKAISNLAVLG